MEDDYYIIHHHWEYLMPLAHSAIINPLSSPTLLWLIILLAVNPPVSANDTTPWVIGVELGELPLKGAFKPGVNLGYRFTQQHELFISYQQPDKISRGSDSFNAQSSGLKGLTSSTETVSKRAQVLGIWRWQTLPLYLSYGLVYNGQDSEHMSFREMPRQINNQSLQGPLSLTLTRPAGYSPALGLGIRWPMAHGYEIFAQWSGNVFQKAVTPDIQIYSNEIKSAARETLTTHIKHKFRKKITNVYHVFSMGMRY